ncbi:Hypothetical predicted protein [Xyrichtys novacula]|uniref:Uncharacterized protein n=1 Tax=Xyrichtys novacula TaxID=13765 RepID=A0AAV1GN11_XYRNO|nr:Hypothetical predicted protein [Xyrichtys novacula]
MDDTLGGRWKPHICNKSFSGRKKRAPENTDLNTSTTETQDQEPQNTRASGWGTNTDHLPGGVTPRRRHIDDDRINISAPRLAGEENSLKRKNQDSICRPDRIEIHRETSNHTQRNQIHGVNASLWDTIRTRGPGTKT